MSDISIDPQEIQWDFFRASGPGGQNINKVATAVKLRFDVKNSPSLPDEVRQRLICLAGKRLTEDGILIIESSRFRSQNKNRQDALDKFFRLIREAAKRPKTRHPTRPTLRSRLRRLEDKRRHGEVKLRRREKFFPDD